MGDKLAVEAAARNNVWLAYPMNPAPGQRWVIFAWAGAGIGWRGSPIDGYCKGQEIDPVARISDPRTTYQ